MTARHAIVTGGGRGIGRACAAALTRAGWTVTVLGRDEARLREAVAAGDAAGRAVADVTNEAGLASALERAAAERGPVLALVANAGAAESAPFGRSDTALFERMISLNLMGVVHATRAVLPGMTQAGFGRVVAVASTAGLVGYPYVTAYTAAKHAVVGFCRALGREVAGKGVTVNAVCPGYVETDLVAESLERIVAKTGRSMEEARAELLRDKPLGRLVRPEEVGAMVAYLCSDAAAAVTGAALPVAGGEV